MALTFNGLNIKNVIFKKDGVETSMNIVENQDGIIWCKPFTITSTQTMGVDTVTIYRSSSNEPSVSAPGYLSSGDTVYYGDKLEVYVSILDGWTGDSGTGYFTVTSDISINVIATSSISAPVINASIAYSSFIQAYTLTAKIYNLNAYSVTASIWFYNSDDSIAGSYLNFTIAANSNETKSYAVDGYNATAKATLTKNGATSTTEWGSVTAATEAEMLVYLRDTGGDIALSRSGDDLILSFAAFPEKYALYANQNSEMLYTQVLRHRTNMYSSKSVVAPYARYGGSTTMAFSSDPNSEKVNKVFSRPHNLGNTVYGSSGLNTTIFIGYPTYNELKAGYMVMEGAASALDGFSLHGDGFGRDPGASGYYQLVGVEMGVLHDKEHTNNSNYTNSDNGYRMLSNVIYNQS